MSAERSLVALILAGTALWPRAAFAQDEPEILPPPVVSAGTAVYDDGGRRDPFVPLIVELEPFAQGPRFESLRLTGVFLGAPSSSLVVLEDPAKRGYFVRVGEQIGNAVLIEIRPRSAVFEIREYGAVRREVLELRARESTPVIVQPQQPQQESP
ncbi:MAG TPA: hypothetical protein VM778_05465 [Gemmatimonadota bacterium]|nr:hypothetical protein [Gemmatimonadota bacterium]